jgi:hypothetical protein
MKIERAHVARITYSVGYELGEIEGTATPGLRLHGVPARVPVSKSRQHETPDAGV